MPADTKFFDLIIASFEAVYAFQTTPPSTLVNKELLAMEILKLKLFKQNFVNFITEYEASFGEIFKKLENIPST